MLAWKTGGTAGELELSEVPDPVPLADEVQIKVEACGVCRTDLHVIDQELAVHRPNVIPGHQIVGVVRTVGEDVRRLRMGDRVGVAWLRRTCGRCRWCREGRENLCPDSEYTGWDADGGFAELTCVPETFAYPLAEEDDPVLTAPLLCAGIIGYRALRRANLPPGGRLGIYGFGSSGHLTGRLALASGAELFVLSRGEHDRELAEQLGAVFVGGATSPPPEPLDAAIVFAPAGDLVPHALAATARGGTVVVAGIHLSDIPSMGYREHLFQERDLRSVAANTRADGDAFLRLARTLQLGATVTPYSFHHADRAITDLRDGRRSGSLVIRH